MTNQTSIKYISSLLNNPDSINDGDQSSISLFRQTFPYFVPMRYLMALESHRKTPNSPQMLSAIMPYLGDWILFTDFLNEGSKPASGNRNFANPVMEEKRVNKPILQEKAETAAAEEKKGPVATAAQPVAPSLEEELRSYGPIIAVVTEEPKTFQAPRAPVAAVPLNKTQAAPGKPVEVKETTAPEAVPQAAGEKPPVAPGPANAETRAEIVPEPVVNEWKPELAAREVEMEVPVSYSPPVVKQFSPVVPSPVEVHDEAEIVHQVIPGAGDEKNIPIPLPVEIPGEEAGHAHISEPEPGPEKNIPIPLAVNIPVEEKPTYASSPGRHERLFMDLIIDHEEIITAEQAESYAEPVSGISAEAPEDISVKDTIEETETEYADSTEVEIATVDTVIDESIVAEDERTITETTLAEGEKIAEGLEIVNEQEADTADATINRRTFDPLIFPIYTRDYFLQQGEKVSDEIPLEINELKDDWRGAGGVDKSLMVVMSFSEWLLHFKNSSEKQKEETKDQRALKTMWQKEKLAAAIEEENEEIPESVFAMAVNSISKEDGLMSETLAEIYIKQGKYDKAVEMYRKLSLKNPQKSAYFAVKIDEALKDKEL